MAVWLSGNDVRHTNEVTLSVPRWVTILRYTILVFNQVTHGNSAWWY